MPTGQQESPGQSQHGNEKAEHKRQAKRKVKQGGRGPEGFGFLFNRFKFIKELVDFFQFLPVPGPEVLSTGTDSNAGQGVFIQVSRRIDGAWAKQ